MILASSRTWPPVVITGSDIDAMSTSWPSSSPSSDSASRDIQENSRLRFGRLEAASVVWSQPSQARIGSLLRTSRNKLYCSDCNWSP